MFLIGILCIYSCLCFAIHCQHHQGVDLPFLFSTSAERPGEPMTHTDPPIGTVLQVSPCQTWMQIASGSSHLSCVCSHWWSFTRKLGSVSPHVSNCYFQPHCPGMAPVSASTVGISREPLLPSSSGVQSHSQLHKTKSWL